MNKIDDLSLTVIEPILQEIDQFAIKMSELVHSIKAINENIVRDNSKYDFEYLQEKRIQTAVQLFSSFLIVASESLTRQIESSNAFKQYYESYFSQTNDFNQSILKTQERINNLNTDIVKKRATKSMQNQIDNFYSIYNISMKI